MADQDRESNSRRSPAWHRAEYERLLQQNRERGLSAAAAPDDPPTSARPATSWRRLAAAWLLILCGVVIAARVEWTHLGRTDFKLACAIVFACVWCGIAVLRWRPEATR